ncbi:DinB/YfiT-like putative metalloenzymes [Klenkia terrae]|uniref:hypothetical protein n=1 Tax=Klenkia terrae TaxID=1052259 RepID=UPI00175E8DBF|nr:hypothetical protein [Klenkia terrae]SSC22250.1 DinB/YfiT-like putative metalloenzymes [Klenkia terrae]
MGGDDVRTAVDEAVAVLSRVPDPTAPVLDTDVAGVVWHIGECLHWYGHDLLLGRVDLTAGRYERDPDAGYGRLVTGLTTWGEVLARVLDAADPGERGFPPFGSPAPAGFAAMACAEVLVHTGDVVEAVGLRWSPPVDVVVATLARVFPDAPTDTDPATTLRWATGRADLPGRPRPTSWRYASAP